MKNKVYVPQEPSRFDERFGVLVPTVDLRHAAAYGEVRVLLPANVSGMTMAPVVAALKEQLKDFAEEDFFVALGDPSIIAACAAIVLRRVNSMKMLKWDKRNKHYVVVEIKL